MWAPVRIADRRAGHREGNSVRLREREREETDLEFGAKFLGYWDQ